jgi:hypothetical protein
MLGMQGQERGNHRSEMRIMSYKSVTTISRKKRDILNQVKRIIQDVQVGHEFQVSFFIVLPDDFVPG